MCAPCPAIASMSAAGSRPAPVSLFLQHVGHHEAAPCGIEVEDLAIAPPGHRGLNLALRFFIAKLLVEHVEKELLGYCMIALRIQRATNLPKQQHVFERRLPEDFLLTKDLGARILGTLLRDARVALLHPEKPEQLRSIYDGQQVVDLKSQII